MEASPELIDNIMLVQRLVDRQWNISGHLAIPSEDDVQKVLDNMHARVYDGEEGTQVQVGGLLMKKQDGHVDVYIHLGEVT